MRSDGAGGLIAIGGSGGAVGTSVSFDGHSYVSSGSDGFAVAYDAQGAVKWLTTVTGSAVPGSEPSLDGLEVDTSGRAVVWGRMSTDMTIGSTVIPSAVGAGTAFAFLARLDATGTPTWTATISDVSADGGTSSDAGTVPDAGNPLCNPSGSGGGLQSVGVDPGGNLYVVGFARAGGVVAGHALSAPGQFIVKLDPGGSVVWERPVSVTCGGLLDLRPNGAGDLFALAVHGPGFSLDGVTCPDPGADPFAACVLGLDPSGVASWSMQLPAVAPLYQLAGGPGHAAYLAAQFSGAATVGGVPVSTGASLDGGASISDLLLVRLQ